MPVYSVIQVYFVNFTQHTRIGYHDIYKLWQSFAATAFSPGSTLETPPAIGRWRAALMLLPIRRTVTTRRAITRTRTTSADDFFFVRNIFLFRC